MSTMAGVHPMQRANTSVEISIARAFLATKGMASRAVSLTQLNGLLIVFHSLTNKFAALIAPPNAPVDPPTSPIAPPTPTNTTVDQPPGGPGANILAPAIAVPVVAVGVALFLAIFFGKKRAAQKQEKEDQKDGSDVESNSNAVAMTTVANATGVAPASMNRTSAQYNSIPQDVSASNDTEINPTGINPADIDKRMHIAYKSLVFTKEIGAGSYGKVFLG